MRKSGLITAAALLISTSGALAAPASDYVDNPVVQEIGLQLASQGYVIVDIERTWLGRLKIDAIADGFEREIIISAVSGMVLHDDWEASSETATAGLDGNNDGIADTLEEGLIIAKPDDGESDSGSESTSKDDTAVNPIVVSPVVINSGDTGSDGAEGGDTSGSDGSDSNSEQD